MSLGIPFKTTCAIPVTPEVPAQKVAGLLPAMQASSLGPFSSGQVMPLVCAPLDLKDT